MKIETHRLNFLFHKVPLGKYQKSITFVNKYKSNQKCAQGTRIDFLFRLRATVRFNR
jgi:hypothetical protein